MSLAQENRSSLDAFIERLFAPARPAVVVRWPRARRADDPAPIEIPTQAELEVEGTAAAMGAVKLSSHALAAIIERRTGKALTARELEDDARGLAIIFCNHYRAIERRRRARS